MTNFRFGLTGLLLATATAFAEQPITPTAFALPDDLEVTLWARAPQFFNPTNIDVDIQGRVWIAEAVNYRSFKATAGTMRHEAGDRIMVLEDTNGDGRADASNVFVQDKDLIAPLGLAVLGNRVVVSCSPSLIVYTDVDGNGRFDPATDTKETLLTGFGGLDHDHGLHALVAGPDGRWYFNAGNAGAHTVTDRAGWTLRAGSWCKGGTPYNTENVPGRRSDDGRVYVGGLAMAIEPDGSGLSIFAHNFRNNYETCIDSLGNVFQNDNDDQVVACRTTWLMQYANAGYSSADGRRSWQADQRPGQSVPRAHWHQDDPGVIPMGDLYGAGSPTGAAVYESDALGGRYRGMLLSCEAGRNAVFGYRVRPRGAGFDLERFSLLSSGLPDDANYKWREVQQDHRRWFRPSDVAVGPDGAIYVADWFDPIVGGHAMHDQTGSAAIYRIAPKGRRLNVPRIDLESTEGQVAALKSPAPNVRFLGFQQLREGGARSLSAIQALLADSNPYVRARAIWLMAQLGAAGRAAVGQLLADPDADTRVVALRALRRANGDRVIAAGNSLIDHLRELASDSSPAVRREVALALRDVPYDECSSLLIELADGFDGRDRWYLEAWGTACEGREDAVYGSLVERASAKSPLYWDDRLASLVWRLHPPPAADALLSRAVSDRLDATKRKQAIDTLAFISARQAAEAMTTIAASGPQDQRENAQWWIGFRRHNLWQQYADVLPPEPIDRSPEPSARAFAGQPSSRPAVLVKLPPLAELAQLKGNAGRGRKLAFGRAECAKCHRFGDEGKAIGPDLSDIGRKFDRPRLLESILKPSAAIALGYETWLVSLTDGRQLAGFIIGDGDLVLIKDAQGQQHAVAAEQIEARQQQGISLMPEIDKLGLTGQDLADIAEFLSQQRSESSSFRR